MGEYRLCDLNGVDLRTSQLKRYPMLMLDRITELLPGKSARGYKNVSNNEWFFEGHFRDNPIMPGTIQLESLYQLATLTILSQSGLSQARVTVVRHKMKLKREIRPGDRMELEIAVNPAADHPDRWEAAGRCTTERGLAFSASLVLEVTADG